MATHMFASYLLSHPPAACTRHAQHKHHAPHRSSLAPKGLLRQLQPTATLAASTSTSTSTSSLDIYNPRAAPKASTAPPHSSTPGPEVPSPAARTAPTSHYENNSVSGSIHNSARTGDSNAGISNSSSTSYNYVTDSKGTVLPSGATPERMARLQDPSYLSTLDEFMSLLCAESLSEMQTSLPEDDLTMLAQVLDDLAFLDSQKELAERVGSSSSSSSSSSSRNTDSSNNNSRSMGSGGRGSTARLNGSSKISSSRASNRSTSSSSVTVFYDSGGGSRLHDSRSLEAVKASRCREIQALQRPGDFGSYLRGMFSALDDDAFSLVLDSIGSDVELMESLYNEVYAFEDCPEEELSQRYTELSQQMEDTLEHFSKKPQLTLPDVLAQQGRRQSGEAPPSSSPSTSPSGPQQDTPTVASSTAQRAKARGPKLTDDPSTSETRTGAGRPRGRSKGSKFPLASDDKLKSATSALSQTGDDSMTAPAGLDMRYILGGEPSASADRSAVPEPTVGASGSQTARTWGASVKKGRPPKARGALFPRPAPESLEREEEDP